MTRNSSIEYLGEVTVAPITSTIRDIPSEVLLDEQEGMKHDCVINLDHIQTVSKGKVGALITKLSSEKLHELRKALNFALGFSEET